jgi:hypothetical protein
MYTLATRTYRNIFRDKNLADLLGEDELGKYWGEVVQGHREPPFVTELRPEDWKAIRT